MAGSGTQLRNIVHQPKDMLFKMICDEFYKIIKQIISTTDDIIPLHAPFLDREDIASVAQTIESGWVSYQGEIVNKFEQELGQYLKTPYVISTTNGTSALFAVLKALGIDEQYEVLLPSLTFAATANAIIHTGATPHFIDSNEKTLNIDFDKLEDYLEKNTYINSEGNLINKSTAKIIKAFIPVHVLGSSCDLNRIGEISHKFALSIIEDAAEALGSEYHGQKVSALTGTGILSFNGNKIITTGGGGAVVTHNKELALTIRHLTTTAKKSHRYEFIHDKIGYNLRLPALNAALGFSQMQKIEAFLTTKRRLYEHYRKMFERNDFGKIFDPDSVGNSNCWLNAFILDKGKERQKNPILDLLNDKKIQARPLWKPLHTLDIYKNFPRSDCSVTENLYERVICLPSSVSLVNHA